MICNHLCLSSIFFWHVSEILRPANPKIIGKLNLEADKQEHMSLSRQNGSKHEQMAAIPSLHCNLTFCRLRGVSQYFALFLRGRRKKTQRTGKIYQRRNIFVFFPANARAKETARNLAYFFFGGGGEGGEVTLSLELKLYDNPRF